MRSGTKRAFSDMEKILLLIVGFLQLYFTQADDLPCSVTQTAEGTFYTVQQFDTSPYFFWMSSTDHNLAFQVEEQFDKVEQVVNFNKTNLLLKECEEVVLYKTTDSQGEHHTAKCSTICRKTLPEPAGTAVSIQKQPEPAGRGHFWMYFSLGLLLVLVVVVVFVIMCRNSDRLPSIRSMLGFKEVQQEPREQDL